MDKQLTIAELFGVVIPTPAASKIAVPCSNPTLIAGVELEIEDIRQPDGWLSKTAPRALWTIDRDGSLRPRDFSYEFISKPMMLASLMAEMEEFFKRAQLEEKNYSDRCSVHVHTNVTDFTPQQISNLALVYSVVEEVLFQFVNHYKSPTPEGYCRDTNIYCVPWNQCRMNQQFVHNFTYNTKAVPKVWQKYTALNLVPIHRLGTVEWRHMHGTNDMEKLTIWMNVIGCIMKFAKMVELDDLIKTVKILNDTSAYQQFFTSVFQGYLPYDEGYQAALAEGVINAKLSLVDWGSEKKEKLSAKKTAGFFRDTPQVLDDGDVDEATENEVFNAILDAPIAPRAWEGVRVGLNAPRAERMVVRPLQEARVRFINGGNQ